MREKTHVGGVGGGLMGSGIVEVAARRGMDLVHVEAAEAAAEQARQPTRAARRRAEQRGRASGAVDAGGIPTALPRVRPDQP